MVNINEASTIVFILSIIMSFSTVIVGLVPPAYAALVISVFGVISEVINFLKSGYQHPVKYQKKATKK